ncbi:altered inheritance of mitochondria protein 3-like [Sinocyclocheilus anshuiensis]|uniref:altered inheritance of mitochondria protein 3-like n=1 Tax=Sinocyclocheilus anshuiensis TaxID=1608454 RepID=UPI0007B7ED77|nr:PREDICTED: altered inheritance of mitochondria protein 3-like [Sinocyclocheilus anshuiensis]
MEDTIIYFLRISLAFLSLGVHGQIGSVDGFVRSAGYPGYYEAGPPLQDVVKPQNSSWYGQGDASGSIEPLRSKNIPYSAAVRGVYSSESYSPQTVSFGSGPVTSVHMFGSVSSARNQLQGSLISLAGSGRLVSSSVATALGTSVNRESVPQPAQLSSQTPVQTSRESVVSSSQQPMQTSSQSSAQQPFIKSQKGRLAQVGSECFSGTSPDFKFWFYIQACAATKSVLPPVASNQHKPATSLQQPSLQKPGLTRYQPVSQPSGLQSAQTSYQSVPRPGGQKPRPIQYQPISQPSGLQTVQASYQSMQPPSLQKAGLTRYQPVSQPSSQQSAQIRYQSVPQPSGLQSAQANYQSMQPPSGQKPGLTRYQPVSQPSGLQSSQTSYQSAQAHYQSASQPSGQSVSLQPGFQLSPMPEQSSYASLSSFGSQPLEQPSNVQLASSYESVLQPDLQDTAPLRSQTTQNERLAPGMLRMLQQVKS